MLNAREPLIDEAWLGPGFSVTLLRVGCLYSGIVVAMPSAPRRISVVIPCYNDATLLQRALNSFANQDVLADEIIVVDNNCTDSSAQVAASFPRVRVVREPRQGITWAAACGYSHAQGDLIVRTDADVVVPPDHIRRVHQVWDLIERQSCAAADKTVVAVTGTACFDLAGGLGRAISALYVGAYYYTTGSALGHYPIYGTNCVIHTQWWHGIKDNIDLADTAVHDDLHLSFAVRDDETVWYQPDLSVDMDARAIRGISQLKHRFQRGFHTMNTNFHNDPPHRRLQRRGKIVSR